MATTSHTSRLADWFRVRPAAATAVLNQLEVGLDEARRELTAVRVSCGEGDGQKLSFLRERVQAFEAALVLLQMILRQEMGPL